MKWTKSDPHILFCRKEVVRRREHIEIGIPVFKDLNLEKSVIVQERKAIMISEEESKKISRRKFVTGAAVIGAGALAGCVADKIVKETVEVTRMVQQTVEVTRMVEPPPAGGEPAIADGPVTLEVLDPSGAFEVTTLFAPRLDTLEGKTVCFLSDEEWMSWRTFPLLKELLTQQYPTIKIIDWEDMPRDGDHGYPDFKAHPTLLQDLGCDAAIVGNAG